MCYDVKATVESQLHRVERVGDLFALEEIDENLIPLTDLPLFHVSGFNHPEMLIYTSSQPNDPEVATWGLIPHWVIDEEQQKQVWNKTLNARGETIYKLPSFRDAAQSNHCIVYVDGFYEHHHYEGNTYPFYIYRKDKKPIALAGLYSRWENETGGTTTSFTIVTTKGNDLLAKIHNNPKLKEPRMPLILDEDSEDIWLQSIGEDGKEKTQQLITSFPSDLLTAHTVQKLRGKAYVGNIEEISKEVIYEDLVY